jgi:hypothetical protein
MPHDDGKETENNAGKVVSQIQPPILAMLCGEMTGQVIRATPIT